MKLNALEFSLMNNPVRAASQRWIETPLLIGKDAGKARLAGRWVLEVGCGRGVGLEILLSLGATHVTGVDLDPRMVALAQKRVARYGSRARALVGDAEALDAPDGSFDAVVDYGVLHHVPNWSQALREVARVLKPGGVFSKTSSKGLSRPGRSALCSIIPRTRSSPRQSFAPGWRRPACGWTDGGPSENGALRGWQTVRTFKVILFGEG